MKRLVIETEEDWKKFEAVVRTEINVGVRKMLAQVLPQDRVPGYTNWMAMRQRCSNPNRAHYEMYGGRGIKVCERWGSFRSFIEDMGPKPSKAHSIDRVDPDGNYEPGNCRWATTQEQGRNQRKTRYVNFNGERKSIRELAETHGIEFGTLYSRIVLWGWPVSDAVNTKLHGRWKRRGH